MKRSSKAGMLRPLVFFVVLEFAGLLIGMIGLGMRNGPVAGLAIIAMFAALVYALVWGIRSISRLG